MIIRLINKDDCIVIQLNEKIKENKMSMMVKYLHKYYAYHEIISYDYSNDKSINQEDWIYVYKEDDVYWLNHG